MRIVKGATVGEQPTALITERPTGAAADGLWIVSPDEVTVALPSITFYEEPMNYPLTPLDRCSAVYVRSAPVVSPLAAVSV